jgi:hypothetical protein
MNHLKDIEIGAKSELKKLINFEANDLIEDIENVEISRYTKIKQQLRKIPVEYRQITKDKFIHSFKIFASHELNSNYSELNANYKALIQDKFKCADINEINNLVAIFGIRKFQKLVSSIRQKPLGDNEKSYSEIEIKDLTEFSNSEAGNLYSSNLSEDTNRKLISQYFAKYKDLALEKATKKIFGY